MSGPKQLIYTNENCVGCYKCINACSCMGANTLHEAEDGELLVRVDSERCSACGACLRACGHEARGYRDDTEEFFADLRAGEPISLLIAPSFAANYPREYEAVLGGLKSLGVKHLINTAFGADIAAWAYVNFIDKRHFEGGISTACPAVVSYIEKYRPQLIKKLMPVHSPMMCAAIYARKHLGITDRFAYVSPCVAAKEEMNDPDTGGLISYNLTFSRLMEYARANDISGEPGGYDTEYGPGCLWPMPGGLKENIRRLLGDDVYVRQIAGEKKLYHYLNENAEQLAAGRSGFTLIEALNCEHGCLCAPDAAGAPGSVDDKLLYTMRSGMRITENGENAAWWRESTPDKRLASLNECFKELKLSDYHRRYTDRSAAAAPKQPDEAELKRIFISMRKDSLRKREINCSACGCESCREMAISIYNGFNRKENCVYYMRDKLSDEQRKLRYLVEYDQELRILNRSSVRDRFIMGFRAEDRFSLLMADLNSLRGVNATYGLVAGDALLKSCAAGLRSLAGRNEWILGRYSGNAFMLVLPDKKLTPDAAELEEIMEALTQPILYGGEHLSTTVSMGISVSDGETQPGEHIVAAEKAMKAGGVVGHSSVSFYSEEQRAKEKEENEIRDKVWDALENDGFFMVYQPKVDAQTKQLCGFEALVRMKTPGVYPGQFIPIAEKNGWIWRIGRITTRLVVEQLAAWRDAGQQLHPVSVNFSSNQLQDEGYVDFLTGLLDKYDIPAPLIEIEITEGLFLDKTAQAQDLFTRFKELGIRLLMDDFGTGYSSLGYLTYIPVDVIKLDKSLVDTYLVEGKDNFIRNVIQLMHDLDKEMTIEGVEEQWQYERLKEFKADVIQGYYFSKPLPADEAIAFVPA